MERNRRLALALQVENPNDRTKPPAYSEFLKDFARRDPAFARMVHGRLAELVRLAKDSKQRSRQHSFECMNRDKRQFVHELSDHFGVESESHDSEPKRNVVATAHRDRVWLPTQALADVVAGQRKMPMPASSSSSSSHPALALSSLGSTNAWAARAAARSPVANNNNMANNNNINNSKPVVVDYFDD